MDIKFFYQQITELNINFFTGVPDSQLKPLCDFLMNKHGINQNHIIAANEGASVGLASGHYLATGNPALVYMQNSGIGNAINPICSLINDKVYAIPMLFVIGWRGEPGVKDEPQHVYQGEITLKLLECLGIEYFVLSKDTSDDELVEAFACAKKCFEKNLPFSFVVKKGTFKYSGEIVYENSYPLTREEIVNFIIDGANESDILVSTTGKLSRELFEAREAKGQGHKRDFLTVGSMGHSSMIGLGIALNKPDRRVLILDGDGAMLMHMGSVAIVGANSPKNIVHFVINNGAHETVGGMPTVSNLLNYGDIATACGYKHILCAETESEVKAVIAKTQNLDGPVFVEIKSNLKSREDLGRPTTTPVQNKESFMEFVKEVF